MKKTYIAPAVKTIDLNTEDALLLTVSGGDTAPDGTDEWGDSNRRDKSASSCIWENMDC